MTSLENGQVYSIQFGEAAIIAPFAEGGNLKTGPIDTHDAPQQWVLDHGSFKPMSKNLYAWVADGAGADTAVQLKADKYTWNVDTQKNIGVVGSAEGNQFWVVKGSKVTLGANGSVLTFKLLNVNV